MTSLIIVIFHEKLEVQHDEYERTVR